MKGIEAQTKSPTPTRVIEAHIGDEEQNKKQKEKENKERTPTQPPWTLRSPPTIPFFFYAFLSWSNCSRMITTGWHTPSTISFYLHLCPRLKYINHRNVIGERK